MIRLFLTAGIVALVTSTGGQPPLIHADMARFRIDIGETAARGIMTGLKDLVR